MKTQSFFNKTSIRFTNSLTYKKKCEIINQGDTKNVVNGVKKIYVRSSD